MNTTTTKKRTFYEQFKRDAVALLEGGCKAAQLARELGVSSAVAAAVEIASLRRELDAIRAQNDILKNLGHSSSEPAQQDYPGYSSIVLLCAWSRAMV